MKSVEILKQADRIVAGLITDKTPPIFETCRAAYADLGDLVLFARSQMADGVTEEFAEGINDVIKRLDVYRAIHVAQVAKAEKKMTHPEFALYLKGQVAKALKEDPARALQRLHAFQAGILKAYTFESDETVTIPVYVDPWQSETTEDGQRTSGAGDTTTELSMETLNTDETTSISAASTLKAVASMVEKAAAEATEMADVGWEMDLASPQFLRGDRRISFGKDGTPAK